MVRFFPFSHISISREIDPALSKRLLLRPQLTHRVAIAIALYRPQIGPLARNGEKMAKKWILAPLGKKWGKWPKNGNLAIFDPFFGQFFPIFRPFFGHFPVGAKIHFPAIFPISGQRADLGSVQGNRVENRPTCYSNAQGEKSRKCSEGRSGGCSLGWRVL